MANRKRNRQLETNGLIITRSLYGNRTALSRNAESRETQHELTSQVLDVTLPLNFLVSESGQLKVFLLQVLFLLAYVVMNPILY